MFCSLGFECINYPFGKIYGINCICLKIIEVKTSNYKVINKLKFIAVRLYRVHCVDQITIL